MKFSLAYFYSSMRGRSRGIKMANGMQDVRNCASVTSGGHAFIPLLQQIVFLFTLIKKCKDNFKQITVTDSSII